MSWLVLFLTPLFANEPSSPGVGKGPRDDAVQQRLLEAAGAVANGDLARADQLLAEAAAEDLTVLAALEARLQVLRRRAAESLGERGRIAMLVGKPDDAVEHYTIAEQMASTADEDTRGRYRALRVGAMVEGAYRRNDPERVARAVQLAEQSVVEMAPGRLTADTQAATHGALGQALRALGELRDPAALPASARAFAAARSVYAVEEAPGSWARWSSEMGRSWLLVGQRGNPDARQAAIAAYEAALAIHERQDRSRVWATAKLDVAQAYAGGSRRSRRVGLANAREALAWSEANDDSVGAIRARRLIAQIEAAAR